MCACVCVCECWGGRGGGEDPSCEVGTDGRRAEPSGWGLRLGSPPHTHPPAAPPWLNPALSFPPPLPSPLGQVTAVGLAHVARMPRLSHLDLTSTRVTTVEALAPLGDRLKRLVLQAGHRVAALHVRRHGRTARLPCLPRSAAAPAPIGHALPPTFRLPVASTPPGRASTLRHPSLAYRVPRWPRTGGGHT